MGVICYDASGPHTVCAFCGDDDSDHYTCDDCGVVMCCECMAHIADPDCPNEFCEECIVKDE